MRIRQIGLRSVLHYEDRDVDFGRRMTGCHVLYGPNETGKSTLLQVMLDLLFGGKLEARAGREESLAGPLRDLYTAPSARIVGVLEAPDGRELLIERKKSRSQLILSEGTMAGVTEDVLVNLLGGYDRERFHLLFGFDHERLRSGGQGLLQSGGHAGISLFEAGGGIAHLQRLLDSLTKQSTDLLDTSFRGNSRKRLNQAWLEARAARKEADQSGLRGEKWHATRKQLEAERAIVERLCGEREEVARNIQAAQRLLRIWEPMTERKRLVADRARLQEQPVMDLADVTAIESLWRELEQAQTNADRAVAALDGLRTQVAELVVADDLLAQATTVQTLLDELSLYRAKKQKELPGLDHELATIGQKVDSSLQRLAPGRELEDVILWRLPEDREQVLSRLAKDWQAKKAQRAQADERLQEQEVLWQSLEAQREALPDRLNVEELKRCLARTLRHGDLDKELSDHAREIDRLKADLEQRMTRQPVWKGDWRALVQQAWPLRESVDRYEQWWREAQQQVALADSAVTKANEVLTRLTEELADLQIAGDVPDETQLDTLREARDSQWRRICANWLSGAPLADDPYELAQGYAKGVVLKLGGEQGISGYHILPA
ncbi:MAG: AAA family ATPase [Firmicutes bacterium]|nr:AAA family ATPase [Bacillota bacterium]